MRLVQPHMYVRDGKSRDKTWLRDGIEAMGLGEAVGEPQEYVVAVEEESDERAGFGRLCVQADEPVVGELTHIGVRESWRDQGVGAHIIERLLTKASDAGVKRVYLLTDEPDYPAQFGFERVDDRPTSLAARRTRTEAVGDGDIVTLAIDPKAFEMPSRLRDAFKTASGAGEEPTVDAEEFGIDADGATYKYDTGN